MDKTLILVVEDDLPVQNLITVTLKAEGYRFLTAQTGQAAVITAATHNPDIILLDLGLPDLDGVEVIRRVRSWSNVPIIVISARSEDPDKIDALDAGADDYLTKPFSVAELLARLRVPAAARCRHAGFGTVRLSKRRPEHRLRRRLCQSRRGGDPPHSHRV